MPLGSCILRWVLACHTIEEEKRNPPPLSAHVVLSLLITKIRQNTKGIMMYEIPSLYSIHDRLMYGISLHIQFIKRHTDVCEYPSYSVHDRLKDVWESPSYSIHDRYNDVSMGVHQHIQSMTSICMAFPIIYNS